jgi:hypothetical protein
MATLDERLSMIEEYLEGITPPSFVAAIREARSLLEANMTPGFICKACGIFTGIAKGMTECRSCGVAR